MRRDFDKFDAALLNLLQRDSRTTAEQLADAVPLSSSAITRRVRRLREVGAIIAEVALLSPVLTRSRLRSIVQLQLREHASKAAMNSLRDRIRREGAIQSCIDVSGSFDLMLLVLTRDMTAFTDFIARFVEDDPIIQRFETNFIKSEWKGGTYVEMGEADLNAATQPNGRIG